MSKDQGFFCALSKIFCFLNYNYGLQSLKFQTSLK
jgi:hypothetical protein